MIRKRGEKCPRNALCAQQKRTISRQGRTDHVSDTERIHTEKENGKRHVAGAVDIARAFARDGGGTNARKGEENKRARVYIRIYVHGKPRRGIEGPRWLHRESIGRTPGNKYNKENGGANDADKERRKRRTRRKNEEDGR